MVQLKNEDHFCGQCTQQQIYDEAFESTVFIPPTYLDYNPLNFNESIDKLHAILNKGKVYKENLVVRNEGGTSGSHGSTIIATEEQQMKKWKTRKRFPKGSTEAAQQKELFKIRNRQSAARSHAQKQAYTESLELEVQKFRKMNANLKRLLLQAIDMSLSLEIPIEIPPQPVLWQMFCDLRTKVHEMMAQMQSEAAMPLPSQSANDHSSRQDNVRATMFATHIIDATPSCNPVCSVPDRAIP